MNRASLLTEKRNDSTISENGNIWSAKVSRAAPSGQIGRGRGSRLRANTGHCPRARRMGQFDRGRVKRRGKKRPIAQPKIFAIFLLLIDLRPRKQTKTTAPFLPFKTGPTNGRGARESGLWRKT